MVVVELNNVPYTEEGLRESVRGLLKTGQNKLDKEDTVLAIYRGNIVEVYKMFPNNTDLIHKEKNFGLIEDEDSKLKGERLIFSSSSNSGIIDENDLILT